MPTLAPGSLDRLLAYDWPGNVRELENAIERALIPSHGEQLEFSDFPDQDVGSNRTSTVASRDGSELSLDHIVRNHIGEVLAMANGQVEGKGGAAELLDLNPSTLRYRMKQLGTSYGRKSKRFGS